MIYLYFTIGVVVLIIHQLREDDKFPEFSVELNRIIFPEKKPWYIRYYFEIVEPMLTIVLWPLVVLEKIIGKLLVKKKSVELEIESKIFSVTRENFMQLLTVEKIEQQERVFDPLGAVPDLPFGHLNTAWLKFKSHMVPYDDIWSFVAENTMDAGRVEIREGYVIVRAEKIGPHFLSKWRIYG